MSSSIRTSGRSCQVLTAAFAVTFVAGLLHAQSFPDFPLQTGTGSVPPNIMFILDDSGSMGFRYMPDNIPATSPVEIQGSTYVHNTLFYNPAITYRPWLQADGTRIAGGDRLGSIYSDNALVGPASTTGDLTGDTLTFYVPKTGVTDLSNSTNFYRYQILPVAGISRVVRSAYTTATTTNEGVPGAGCIATEGSSSWRECAFITPTSRTEAAEITNYAIWHSYSRTRTKVAKAGASEAFGSLGENFRVGYDSIWNRNGATAVAGDLPAYQIPVGTDGGMFRGANKAAWFDYLHRANTSGWTPLHGALRRAGTYYETQGAGGPWGPQAGDAQLSCRQSYAILTTDGYWNNSDYFASVGNADNTAGAAIASADGQRTYTYQPTRPYMDDYTDTLADFAMHYWKRDLRPTLANNVPFSAVNPAFWQHMVTFGVSIGLQGTLDPENDVPLITSGDKKWPDVWNGNTLNWGGETPRRIDDLLHAAINSRGRFLVASNPEAFTEALRSSLAVIQRRRASGSNVTSNGPVLNSGSYIFHATYSSGEWSGDLSAVSVVGGVIAGNPLWSLSTVANGDTRPFESRPVLTWNGSAGSAFPTDGQRSNLARTTGPAQVTAADNVAFIKGNRSLEKQNGGNLRDRASPIGDIVNSSPFYAKETDTLYIGSNDGMLHAVVASTGTVLFSYVPAGLNFPSLSSLSDPDYQHRFFVDGGIDVTSRAQGLGSNILVGSLGRGGRGVFGLNVTAPAAFAAGNVLWDRSGPSAETDMGYVLGAPVVRKGSDGSTLVLVGNGVDSNTAIPANSRAYLFVYRLNTFGSIVGTIKIPAGTETGNGLAEPRAADTDGDGDVDYVYAGDLRGNVWKFDLTGNVGSWDNATSITRLFTAVDASANRQPITSAVALARDPASSQIFILVGTGRYVTNGDLSSTSVQSIYGLMDGTTIAGRAALAQRTIASTGTDSLGRAARSFEAYSILPSGKRGWYVDLTIPTAGERVVTAPLVRGRALWFSSIIPKVGTGCDAGGSGYLNAIDAFTGTNPQGSGGGTTTSFIDVNGDGSGNDKLQTAPATGQAGFISSVDLGVGMPAQGTSVGNNIFACGSEAECGKLQSSVSADAKRLSWRELYKRD